MNVITEHVQEIDGQYRATVLGVQLDEPPIVTVSREEWVAIVPTKHEVIAQTRCERQSILHQVPLNPMSKQ
jgi:hypothetical protein